MKADLDRGLKWCPKCEQELPLAAFGADKRASDGLKGWCRACKTEAEKQRLADPVKHERHLLTLRARYQANLEAERERSRARYHANKERDQARHRRERLRARFGMTIEQFDAMFAAQNGRCAICRMDNFQGKRPHIDHCHTTGVIRGLLCVRCNQGLGNFQDDAQRMRLAIAYLENTTPNVARLTPYQNVRSSGRKRAA